MCRSQSGRHECRSSSLGSGGAGNYAISSGDLTSMADIGKPVRILRVAPLRPLEHESERDRISFDPRAAATPNEPAAPRP